MRDLYVAARRVLLDAVEALGPHRDAVVIVGAHAVYLRVGEADLAVAPYTTDADLALDPGAIAEVPPLQEGLTQAGFRPKGRNAVGVWVTQVPVGDGASVEVSVDLLVPASVSPGTGRRAARLPGHDGLAARKVSGLEGALVDVDPMRVAALDTTDTRVLEVQVAGPAALLAAKVHKIQDRIGTDRAGDKDALDVLRLLRGTDTGELARRFARLRLDERTSAVAEAALALVQAQFGSRASVGVEMAVRAARGLVPEDEIAASCTVLVADLLGAVGG